jgi:AAA domain
LSSLDPDLAGWAAATVVLAARSVGAKIFNRVTDDVAAGTVTAGHRILDRLRKHLGGDRQSRNAARQLEARVREAADAPAGAAAGLAALASLIGSLAAADAELTVWLTETRAQYPAEPAVTGVPQRGALRTAFEAVDVASRESMFQFSRGIGTETRRLYVSGLAGTGKTVLALTLAGMHAHRAKDRAGLALYLCYSEPLADELDCLTSGYPGAAGVIIHTPETLFRYLVPDGGRELGFFQEQAQALEDELAAVLGQAGTSAAARRPASRGYLDAPEFWDRLTSAANPGAMFAAVVVDEAQDLGQAAFTALAALAEPDGLFAVLADSRQVTRASRAGRPWHKPYEVSGAAVRVLEHNFRNTRHIAQEVARRVPQVEYLYPGIMPRGTPVDVSLWDDEAALRAEVSAAAARFKGEGLDLATEAAVLVEEHTGAAELDALLQLGECAGLPVFAVDAFKGRERPAIVYVRGPVSGRLALGAPEEQLYVGLSRAVSCAVLLDHAPRRRLG